MFTVLMSVYDREQSEALSTALESIRVQTVTPAEVLVIKDGPLSAELDEIIESFRDRLPLRVHALSRNMGLAGALNEGLAIAKQPWVMRFDSDDICLPDRVAVQQAMAMEDRWQLFGAQIEEFSDDPTHAYLRRRVPTDHWDILQFGLRRNPFNHMTVCFRRELALSLGGYPNIPLMEDYALWMLMLSKGATSANCPQVLVRARAGKGMVRRRGGLRYLRSEWAMQRHLQTLGLKGRATALRDGAFRSAVFVGPLAVRSWIYRSFLRG